MAAVAIVKFFLAISDQAIVWFQQNFVPGSRTACW